MTIPTISHPLVIIVATEIAVANGRTVVVAVTVGLIVVMMVVKITVTKTTVIETAVTDANRDPFKRHVSFVLNLLCIRES